MKFIWHNGRWVEAVRAPRPAMFPAIIRDTMDALLHPATGQMIDSKAEFRRVTRERGYEEIGNEVEAHMAPRPMVRAGDIEADIAQAYDMVEQGHTTPVETADQDIRIL